MRLGIDRAQVEHFDGALLDGELYPFHSRLPKSLRALWSTSKNASAPHFPWIQSALTRKWSTWSTPKHTKIPEKFRRCHFTREGKDEVLQVLHNEDNIDYICIILWSTCGALLEHLRDHICATLDSKVISASVGESAPPHRWERAKDTDDREGPA